jgi:hypothetical protein
MWQPRLPSGANQFAGLSCAHWSPTPFTAHFCNSYRLGLRCWRMPLRKWRLLVFVLAFTCIVPHRSVAGPVPMKYWLFCTEVEPPPVAHNPFSLFPRSVAFPQLQHPTTMFRLDGINLTRITTPPQFRVHDPKAANAMLIHLWHPCPVWHGGS